MPEVLLRKRVLLVPATMIPLWTSLSMPFPFCSVFPCCAPAHLVARRQYFWDELCFRCVRLSGQLFSRPSFQLFGRVCGSLARDGCVRTAMMPLLRITIKYSGPEFSVPVRIPSYLVMI
ncbi:hypothetical protein K438DRAFT_451267 [Mycena galopus ATCC 62051]|nr:hypothetical protein K438DRAFT_451267 [Mycena galopus ATCC 62051]